MSGKNKTKRKPLPPRALRRTPDELVAAGVALHRAGRVDDARAMYQRALEQDRDHPDALHFLGVAEHQRGRGKEALALFERALERAPEHPDIHSNLGNVLKLLGRVDDAEAAYREALSLQPDHTNALSNLGTVMRAYGRLEEAEALLRRAIAIRPDHVEARQNLGAVLGDQREFAEAVEQHREALRIDPRAVSSYRQLGRLYYAMGRIDLARDLYRQWVETHPDDPEARHLLTACGGASAPERAPDAYVRATFDRFATSFDSVLERLQYRAPELVLAGVGEALGVGAPTASLDVLDAGCGTGLCGPLFRPLAKTLTGVDLSAKMLEHARARAVYDALCEAELTAYLTAHPAAYDVVISADTLVYFGALDAVLHAAARATRAGGHVAFTVERSEEEQAPGGFQIHPHGRYSHTERYLRQVLGDAGLEPVSLRPVDLRKELGKWVPGWLVTARR